ncbi:hypothetical protein E2C01_043303 [Portunus trituberculatus]|uniref:Uncharacterized protein n=1 Tax=Portunus trituberculatus TaxID=210409 RepID=A0A5B7FP48_PORTR|nr:hypothetical protein [Portunus trituberculatus]
MSRWYCPEGCVVMSGYIHVVFLKAPRIDEECKKYNSSMSFRSPSSLGDGEDFVGVREYHTTHLWSIYARGDSAPRGEPVAVVSSCFYAEKLNAQVEYSL